MYRKGGTGNNTDIPGTTMEEKREPDILKNREDNAPAGRTDSTAPVRKKTKKPWLLWLFSAAAVIIICTYAVGCFYFSKHFQTNSSFGGADISFMTPHQAVPVIKEIYSQKRISIYSPSGTYFLSGTDVGLSPRDPAGMADMVFSKQPDFYKWPLFFASEKNVCPDGACRFETGRLMRTLCSLPFMRAENMSAPEDAYIAKSSDGNGFVIIKETRGSTVNRFAVFRALAENLRHGKLNLDIGRIPHAFMLPEVMSSSPELVSKFNSLSSAVSGKIVYKIHDSEDIVLGPETLTEWVCISDDGEYYLDEDKWYEKAVEFVDSVAYACNTVWKERDFDTTEDGTVTVPGGTYGYIVDKDEEIDAVMSLFYDGPVNEEREPYYTQKESGDSANHGIGGTYVEVSIDAQHMWYYEDGKLVMDSPVVTGTRGYRDTPRGQFFIQFTQRNAVLLGRPDSNGQPSYRTPVSWWMPFYDGCGLHDASWRGSFGGSIYTYSGSHGCVNMPPSNAQSLFGYVSAGTPVIVY